MPQRGATRADVIAALSGASACRWQSDRNNWKVDGRDLDGDDLTIIVDIQDNLVVVTIY